MRRKSKNRPIKIAFLGYLVLFVGVIGYGWMTRPEPVPYGNVPIYDGVVRMQIHASDGYESLAEIGTGQITPSDEPSPIAEALSAPVMAQESPATDEMAPEGEIVSADAGDELRLDDLRLPGSKEAKSGQFEEVEPNPYLVTD